MIVYCANFKLRPDGGAHAIATVIARWLGIKTKSFVEPNDLIVGTDRRLPDGSRVETLSTISDPQEYPVFFSIKYSHSGDVPSRQWSTEIGVKQDLPDSPFQCSILLQTHEISARVTAPIQPTRPNVVEELIKNCGPVSSTPSVKERFLDENNAKAFLLALEHPDREVPWIIISPTKDGKYLVDPRRLRSLLLGISEVFVIPLGTNTFDIQSKIGGKYAAWLGAINIIHPSRQALGKAFYETYRLVAEQVLSLSEEGHRPENEIFSIITHRTNLPNSWRHISPSAVANARLRSQLQASIKKAQNSTEAVEYVELLMEADKELKSKDKELSALRLDYELKEEENLKLDADVANLKHALSGKRATGDSEVAIGAVEPLRNAVLAGLNGDITLEQALNLIGALFPERVIITDTAFSSAVDSRTFQYSGKALDLLIKLVTTYWEDLVGGHPDAEARKVFGNSYAAKEAESLSSDGRKRRTFIIEGRPIEMLRHLKIGVKDSASETLRVHFEWLPTKKNSNRALRSTLGFLNLRVQLAPGGIFGALS